MSYAEDIYQQSEQQRYMENRSKVNVSIIDFQTTSDDLWCFACIPATKLIFEDNGLITVCPNCGRKERASDIKHEKELGSKFGKRSFSGPLLQSMDKRSKKDKRPKFDSVNSQLSEEEKQELRGYGLRI